MRNYFKKMWRGGIIQSLLSIVLLFQIVFLSSCQNEIIQENDDPAEIELLESDDGFSYAITGRSVTVYGLTDNDRVNLVIPSEIDGLPVTEIAPCAFYKEKSIGTIEFPDSIVKIGDKAFAYCESLYSVTIPKNCTTIGNQAFAHCLYLDTVKISASVTSMAYAFSYNGNLRNVVFEEGLKTIDSGCFYECRSLSKITLPESLEIIGESAFSFTCFSEITIPKNVTVIGDYAFSYISVAEDKSSFSITLSDGIKKIGKRAFMGKNGLTTISLPDSIEYIGQQAFSGTKLSTIKLPENLTYLGSQAFEKTDIKEISIPSKLESLESNVFEGMDIEEIYIPVTVKKMGSNLFGKPEYPSYDSPALRKITIACNLTEDVAATDDPAIELYGEKTEIEYEYCGVEVVFEDTVKTVSGKVIKGIFKSLEFGAVESIRDAEISIATDDSSIDLQTIEFPETLKSIENSNFSFPHIVINHEIPVFEDSHISAGKIEINENLSSGANDSDYFTGYMPTTVDNKTLYSPTELVIGNNVSVVDWSFSDILFSSVKIPDSVQLNFKDCTFDCELDLTGKLSDDKSEFSNCTFNKSVHADSNGSFFESSFAKLYVEDNPSVEEFYNCKIEELYFSDYVSRIEDSAFKYSSVRSLDLSNITYIGNGAFSGSYDIEDVKFSNNPTYIGGYAFCNCEKADFEFNGKIVLNLDSTSCFLRCKNLKTFPQIEGYIPSEAFRECVSLKEASIDNSIELVAAGAFMGCTELEAIHVTADHPNIWMSQDGAILYEKCLNENSNAIEKNLVLAIQKICPEKVVIEDEVKCIFMGAFMNITNLKEVDFNDVGTISSYAFYGCTGLTGSLKFTGIIQKYSFYGCTDLTEVICGAVGDYAFYGCSGIQNLKFENASDIGVRAFAECTGLKKVEFGLSDNNTSGYCKDGSTDDYAFENCSSLEEIILQPWEFTNSFYGKLGSYVYKGCTSVKSVKCYYRKSKYRSPNTYYSKVWNCLKSYFSNIIEYTEVDL